MKSMNRTVVLVGESGGQVSGSSPLYIESPYQWLMSLHRDFNLQSWEGGEGERYSFHQTNIDGYIQLKIVPRYGLKTFQCTRQNTKLSSGLLTVFWQKLKFINKRLLWKIVWFMITIILVQPTACIKSAAQPHLQYSLLQTQWTNALEKFGKTPTK